MNSGTTNQKRTARHTEYLPLSDIWVISKGTYIDLDLGRFYEGAQTTTVAEYKVSELGRYLLNPNPIQVEKKLIGCEVHYRPPVLKAKISRILPPKLRGLIKTAPPAPDALTSGYVTTRAPLLDEDLESHLNRILDLLKPYDPVIKKLSNVDVKKVADVIGTCRDIGGNLSYLNIQGSIDEKMGYIANFIYKNVGVIIEKAYISDGLFEMKGFDFESYDSAASYRLIKFMINGKPKAFVLSGDNTIDYWVEDLKLLHYLQLFDQLIKMNPKLNKSLLQCSSGKAEPMKLFFNSELGINYSTANLPEIYRRVFEMHAIAPAKRDMVKRVLNQSQLGVTFNYVPHAGVSDDKLFVNFSVMHDFKALEALKDDLPQVYSEIGKRSSVTEAGRFYLLDSFRGYKDDF